MSIAPSAIDVAATDLPAAGRWRWATPRVWGGAAILLAVGLACVISLPWTVGRQESAWYYNHQRPDWSRSAPRLSEPALWCGADARGRSLLGRTLLGGCLSLAVGLCAAAISLVVGVAVGLLAGYHGGWVDGLLMRVVDVLYGLPYVLLVVLLKIAFEPLLVRWLSGSAANVIVLFVAIGSVSWLTMARVVRGQVLALRSQPMIEACRALGLGPWRIFLRHLWPNLLGPVVVYATLIVPQAILQESFLSFLGIGIRAPLPTWGSLASDGLLAALNPAQSLWWMLAVPCTLLAITLLALNFLGDGLRDALDPKRQAALL